MYITIQRYGSVYGQKRGQKTMPQHTLGATLVLGYYAPYSPVSACSKLSYLLCYPHRPC